MAQLWILDLGHIVISQHQLRDEYLLINTADHDFFIDRLIVASDEIAVEIHIQVVHGFYVWKRLIYKNIIHVERMLWQFQAAVPKHFHTVNDRMHQDILSQAEASCTVPVDELAFWERHVVVHDLFVFCALFLINEVGNQHIQRHIVMDKFAQRIQNLHIRLFVDPVIAVHDLIIDARRIAQSRIDGLAVTTVFLMNRPANPRIVSLILIGNLRRIIFCGTVIHDQDLHLIAARQQGFDAVTHICRRIVARNRYRQQFHWFIFSQNSSSSISLLTRSSQERMARIVCSISLSNSQPS